MANQDAAFGLRPVGRIGGTPFTGGQNRYRIAANYGTSIFQGDMVMQVTGGGVEIHADGGTVPIVGVFNGCTYTCLLYTSPSPRDGLLSRMPSSA